MLGQKDTLPTIHCALRENFPLSVHSFMVGSLRGAMSNRLNKEEVMPRGIATNRELLERVQELEEEIEGYQERERLMQRVLQSPVTVADAPDTAEEDEEEEDEEEE